MLGERKNKSDYTLGMVKRVKAVKKAGLERLTVCTLEMQSSGKLTHTAARWEHSERWQPKTKEGEGMEKLGNEQCETGWRKRKDIKLKI